MYVPTHAIEPSEKQCATAERARGNADVCHMYSTYVQDTERSARRRPAARVSTDLCSAGGGISSSAAWRRVRRCGAEMLIETGPPTAAEPDRPARASSTDVCSGLPSAGDW